LWHNQRGAALVTVMVAMLIIFFTSATLLQVSAMESRISLNHLDETKALYIADAGISMLMAKLEANHDIPSWAEGWEADFANISVGDGFIESLTVTDQGTGLRVVSTGIIKGPDGSVRSRKSVQVIILKPPYDAAFAGAVGAVQQGNTVGNTLTITGNSEISGNFIYNGLININSSSAVIHGDITTKGDIINAGTVNGSLVAGGFIENSNIIDAGGEGIVQAGEQIDNSGSIYTGAGGVVHTDTNLINSSGSIVSDYFYRGSLSGTAPNGTRLYNREHTLVLVPEVPPVDYGWYLANANEIYNNTGSIVTFEGAHLKDMQIAGDIPYIIYIKGNVRLRNLDIGTGKNYSGVGMIVAEGDIDIDSNLLPDDSNYSSLALISKGNMAAGGGLQLGGIFICEGVYSTNGDVEINGSLIPRIIDVSGHLNIEYSTATIKLLGEGLPGNEYKMKAWREIYSVF